MNARHVSSGHAAFACQFAIDTCLAPCKQYKRARCSRKSDVRFDEPAEVDAIPYTSHSPGQLASTVLKSADGLLCKMDFTLWLKLTSYRLSQSARAGLSYGVSDAHSKLCAPSPSDLVSGAEPAKQRTWRADPVRYPSRVETPPWERHAREGSRALPRLGHGGHPGGASFQQMTAGRQPLENHLRERR